jgi:AhpD family alkylhydroperoxidase
MTALDPQAGPGYQALADLSTAVDADTNLPRGLLELVRLHCSQLNGCTYCTRLHGEAALAAGESSERIDGVTSWRTHPAFTDAERAALAVAEAVTLVHDGHVPQEVLDTAVTAHGPGHTRQLLWVAIVVNAFNRLAITTRLT